MMSTSSFASDSGQESDVVGDRAFNSLRFDIGEFVLTGSQGSFFPGYRRDVRCRCEQLLRDKFRLRSLET